MPWAKVDDPNRPSPDPKRSEEANSIRPVPDFSLVLGGPLFQLLRASHLEGDALELLNRRVVAAILLTWVPLLVLTLFASHAQQVPFLHDIEVHVRFLVSLPVLIGAELLVH